MNHSVKQYELRNGGKALVVNVAGTRVVGMSAVFNSGFYFADKSKFEIPHIVEHLMECGNELYPSAVAFKTEIEKNGAYHNASTSAYLNTYDFECADFEAHRMIEMLGAEVATALLPEESFASEVSNVKEELSRNTSNYGRIASIALSEVMQPDYSLSEEVRIGQLSTITRDEAVEYYRRTHTSNNLRLLMVGDFKDEGAELVKRFETCIEAMPKGERLEFASEDAIKPVAPVLIQKDIQQIYYSVQGYTQEVTYRQRLAGRLLSTILTGGYRSWIYGEARERGLAYHVGSGFSIGPRGTSMSFGPYVTPDHASDLFELIARSYTQARSGKIGDDDLEAAQNLVIGRITRAHQTADDMLGWYAGDFAFNDNVLDFQEYLRDLRSIKKSEVVEMAGILADGVWGLSLVGDIDKKAAVELCEKLQPIWLQ
jgi:predicted Zn-dependent peptidase